MDNPIDIHLLFPKVVAVKLICYCENQELDIYIASVNLIKQKIRMMRYMQTLKNKIMSHESTQFKDDNILVYKNKVI